MRDFANDLDRALKRLGRTPVFTGVVLFTLALGIGANSAVFSTLYGVLLRPLAYEEAERLAYIWESNPDLGVPTFTVSPPNFKDWRDQNQVFEQMVMVGTRPMIRSDGERPERLNGRRVSADFFRMLGIPLVHGRDFATGEDAPGSEPVAILNDSYWRRRYGADPGVVGKTITIDGAIFSIVGVARDEVMNDVDVWLPLTFDIDTMARGLRRVEVWGRLAPGVTAERAQEDMDLIAARLAKAYPDANQGWGVKVVPMLEELVQDFRSTLHVLFAAVSFILLIAFANVLSLFLARAIGKRREVAIQLALGGGRFRLLRQNLAESLLLGFGGALLGLLFAHWGGTALAALYGGNMPRGDEVGIDGRIVAFALALAFGLALLLAAVSTLASRGIQLVDELKDRGVGGGKATVGVRARQVIVVIQVALALVMLLGAGLLTKSLQRLQQVNPGFSTESTVALELFLPSWRYRDKPTTAAFYKGLIERVASLPGVENVGTVSPLPLSERDRVLGYTVIGQPEVSPSERPTAHLRQASPTYFETLKIPHVSGRLFTERDNAEVPNAMVINETMARQQWPGEDPLGKQIAFGNPQNPASIYTVVGVVGDVKHASLSGAPGRETYMNYHQSSPRRAAVLVVHSSLDPLSLVDSIRDQLLAIDPEVPITGVYTLEEHVRSSLQKPRTNAVLVGCFAILALVLAAVGIYSIMSHLVTQRTSELGVRMALGAEHGDLWYLVFKQALILTGVGVGLGLLASRGLTPMVSSLLFEVEPFDTVVYGVVGMVLLLVALLATFVPALRATRIDPSVALQYE